jgi:hypothetical protein
MRAPFELTFSVHAYSTCGGPCPFDISTRNFCSSRVSRRSVNSPALMGLCYGGNQWLEMTDFLGIPGQVFAVGWLMLDCEPRSNNQVNTRFPHRVKSTGPAYSPITRLSPERDRHERVRFGQLLWCCKRILVILRAIAPSLRMHATRRSCRLVFGFVARR